MRMAWSFSSDRPIYLQITEHLRIEIISGKYKRGERLPSVRELAVIASVNPNTMQRALCELEASGLVSSQRTTGRFVTEDSEIIEESKLSLAKELIGDFLKKTGGLGYSPQEAAELVINQQKGNDKNGHNT